MPAWPDIALSNCRMITPSEHERLQKENLFIDLGLDNISSETEFLNKYKARFSVYITVSDTLNYCLIFEEATDILAFKIKFGDTYEIARRIRESSL